MIFQESEQGITFQVKIIPRAKRDEIVGVENGVLKIRVHAPPVDGRANATLEKFLAHTLHVARAQVEIVRGETSRTKMVRVRGITRKEIEKILVK